MSSIAVENLDVLTLSEAASYLRVSEDVLQELASANAVPARRIGDEWRFLKSALKDWLSNPSARGEKKLSLTENGLVAELGRQVLAKLLSLDDFKSGGSPKQRLLDLAGMWKDDPTVDELLKKIYKERGRPMSEFFANQTDGSRV